MKAVAKVRAAQDPAPRGSALCEPHHGGVCVCPLPCRGRAWSTCPPLTSGRCCAWRRASRPPAAGTWRRPLAAAKSPYARRTGPPGLTRVFVCAMLRNQPLFSTACGPPAWQAEEGRLVVMAAGDAMLYDELQPVFALLAKHTFFLGECGQGTLAVLTEAGNWIGRTRTTGGAWAGRGVRAGFGESNENPCEWLARGGHAWSQLSADCGRGSGRVTRTRVNGSPGVAMPGRNSRLSFLGPLLPPLPTIHARQPPRPSSSPTCCWATSWPPSLKRSCSPTGQA